MVRSERLNRRLFLWELGKGAVALAVLGAAAACGDDGEPSAGNGTDETQPDAEAAGGSGELVWKRASLGFVSAYVLARGKEAAVVDTGTDAGEAAVADALGAAGLGWGAVRHVIVTHKHPDHAGGLAGVLGSAAGATAWAGEADIAAIESPRPLQVAADGDEILGLQVVATPGHTPGHISVFDPAARLLVTGDAVVNQEGGLSRPSEQYTEDMGTAEASIKKLAGLTFDTVLVGHGDPVESGGRQAMEALAATIS